MLWKYNLLAGKVDMNDPLQALIKARKAIENGRGFTRNCLPSEAKSWKKFDGS